MDNLIIRGYLNKKRKPKRFQIALLGTAVVFNIFLLISGAALPERIVKQPYESVHLSGLSALFTLKETAAPTVGEVREEQLCLFGILPVKTVEVETAEPTEVYVSGAPFGMKLYSDGVIVVGMTDVDTADGNRNPAREAGIKVGDFILSVNGIPIENNAQAAALLEASGGSPIELTVRRNQKEFSVLLTPAYSVSASVYKAGIWIRDSAAGLGMMTFILPNGICAGLGHGVRDADTNILIPVAGGELCSAKLIGIVKGKCGTPGQLTGCLESGEINGTVLENTDIGLYGKTDTLPSNIISCPIAGMHEAKIGDAEILTTAENGTPKRYRVKIKKINYRGTQNFVLRVTDDALLNLTGGIVQGNSGSPILQNGKLIGAVTHVFVNNPARGYGIFAETMLQEARKLSKASDAA